jgi:hypothetical protein
MISPLIYYKVDKNSSILFYNWMLGSGLGMGSSVGLLVFLGMGSSVGF